MNRILESFLILCLIVVLALDTLVEKAGVSIQSGVYEVEGRSRKHSSTALHSALSASIRIYWKLPGS